MSLIEKEVEVGLNGNNIEYYKNLGRNVLNIGLTGIGIGSVGGCSREISNEQMEKEY